MSEERSPVATQSVATQSVIAECDLDEPPEQVWRALTEPRLLAAWLMPNDIRPEPGRRFTLKGGPGAGGDIACRVEAVEPHRLLRFSWREGGDASDADGRVLDSTVTFVLARTTSDGTHLRIVHSGLPLGRGLAARLAAAGGAIAMALSAPPLRLAA